MKATDNGQVVEDSDLTDLDFRDLEREIRFHSLATRLLQRYGYLMPAVNLDSDFGKERDLILKERGKAKGFTRGAPLGFAAERHRGWLAEALGTQRLP